MTDTPTPDLPEQLSYRLSPDGVQLAEPLTDHYPPCKESARKALLTDNLGDYITAINCYQDFLGRLAATRGAESLDLDLLEGVQNVNRRIGAESMFNLAALYLGISTQTEDAGANLNYVQHGLRTLENLVGLANAGDQVIGQIASQNPYFGEDLLINWAYAQARKADLLREKGDIAGARALYAQALSCYTEIAEIELSEDSQVDVAASIAYLEYMLRETTATPAEEKAETTHTLFGVALPHLHLRRKGH